MAAFSTFLRFLKWKMDGKWKMETCIQRQSSPKEFLPTRWCVWQVNRDGGEVSSDEEGDYSSSEPPRRLATPLIVSPGTVSMKSTSRPPLTITPAAVVPSLNEFVKVQSEFTLMVPVMVAVYMW